MGVDRHLSKEQLEKPYHKLSDIHGSYLRRFYRTLGGTVAQWLRGSGVTPNVVTVTSFLLTIASLPFFYLGVYPYYLIAAGLHFLSMVLDKADGSLARLQGKSTPFGTWLDSTTDYLGIFLLFLVVGAHFHFVEQKPGYWALAMIGYAMYNLSKLLYIFFKRYYGEQADSIVEEEKEKHPLRSSFHVNEVFVNNTILVFTLFGKLDWLLIFLAGYGTLFFLGSYLIFTYRAKKLDRVHSQEEGLKAKF